MVGVVIGLIAVLVIYQVFAAAEGIKRNTTSVGDAQQNGLLSSFILGIELANAGNGVASAARDLGACPGGGELRDNVAADPRDDPAWRRCQPPRYVHGQLQRVELGDRSRAIYRKRPPRTRLTWSRAPPASRSTT